MLLEQQDGLLEAMGSQTRVRRVTRRKTNDVWTDKHCNVMKKLGVEEGWAQKLCKTLVGQMKRSVEDGM